MACLTVAVVAIPELQTADRQQPRFWHEMKLGAKIFLQDRQLCIVTVAACLAMVFYMPLASFYPLMTSDHFQATAWHASLVELGYAAGMLLCSAVVALGAMKNNLQWCIWDYWVWALLLFLRPVTH